ncbi:histidine--tRNA ligase [Candidatus Woesearchaeota archaeon]|nr:histidine--tRNA ligase [Candidatus Woesearchaeota archaeon]
MMQLPKGTKDVSGEEAILKEKIVSTLKEVFSLYGYSPLDTPVVERYETLSSKYSGGDEILKEVFRLTDQGKRELGLRYDLTVPMCRFIAMNPNLKLPFKRYQIGEVFRDGPIKLGRYRQFFQCDVDVVGVKSMSADSEMLMIAKEVFERLKLPVVIKVNNRKLLNAILESSGIEKDKADTVMLTIDKLEKFGEQAVKEELADKGISPDAVKKLFSALRVKGSNAEKLDKISKLVNDESISELREVICAGVEFDPSLARGLSYYTGTVFEVFLKKSGIKSAVAAGGRYDKMIGQFLNSKLDYPAVGISFGLDVIMDALKEKNPELESTLTKAFVIPIKEKKGAAKIASELRKAGINTDMDLSGRNIGKTLDYVNRMGIPFAVFVGEKEIRQKKVKLRDMKTGKEKLVSVSSAAKIILSS